MDATADYIKQRLSLRQPLQESLDILSRLSDTLTLMKNAPLTEELEKVKSLFPSCTSFDREFPSIAYSIATGVGKTRLMGACMAYLHLTKGIRNFFVLAPNLTIYNKLIEDFGNPAYHKYVFAGISAFVHNRPVIITGDNYAQQGTLFSDKEIRINIFNIAKFNSESRGTTSGGVSVAPRIKRLSEYLGQSYWDYLSGLDDLVILMDEAHRYHSDRSKTAINELKPVLGIELTATPIDDDGQPFRNVVYEYSLARALAEGKYVKNPAIARRKNFQRGSMDDRQIEILKLEDAISIHQDTKKELEVYSLNEGAKLVKPFILVVCKDTSHAKDIYDLINSEAFFDGEYKDKVLQIDSTTRREGGIEEQFLGLEHDDNPIEIVIHVNMLKEGWDVTNLYTIVPLRAANASILVEQTIGRGLRLPFDGKRTGVEKIDKLTVVAHENFDAVIEAAQDPNSILNKLTFVELTEEDLATKTQVVTSKPLHEHRIDEEQKIVNTISDAGLKQIAQTALDAKKAIINVLPTFNSIPGVTKVEDLRKDHIKERVLKKVYDDLHTGQSSLLASEIMAEAERTYDKVVSDYKKNVIEIPRISVTQTETKIAFTPFPLDTSGFSYQALEQEIIVMGLKDHSVDTIKARTSGYYDDPVKLIIAQLLDYPEIDYDEISDLLYALASEAVEAIKSKLTKPEEIDQVVLQFKSAIAEKIYTQMMMHHLVTGAEYNDPVVLPFVRIEPWNFSALMYSGIKDYREVINPSGMIPKYVFRGFEKACHFEYKFDSKSEQDLAFVLEHDGSVLRWLRPAPTQFRIYWDNNSKRYEPDFIVETPDTIFMIEVKMSSQMEALDVQAKKVAAEKYCQSASKYTSEIGGKLWAYYIVPHTLINRTITLSFLIT